jgi:UDP-N-acetylmuramate: L-alanyl-gamma-D-glutamyl-meso-diaminopimelate ligase
VESTLEALIRRVAGQARAPCHIVIMSNGGFGGIHQQLIAELERRSG